MRTRAQVSTPRVHIPLARLALCVDCEVCFEIGPEQCPGCGSETWSPLSRFIGDASAKAVVRAVHALVDEARGLSGSRDGVAHHLLIVGREQPKLYQMLQRELSGNPTVTVIQDRRGPGGPRGLGRIPNQRWRNVDNQIRALGWAIVRSEASPAARMARERDAAR
jgi:hypothetical protein